MWKELGVQKDFASWIKDVLEKVDAISGDYICTWINDKGVHFKGDVENTRITDLTGEGYKKEYSLTLSIAKEIAMISGVAGRSNNQLKENSKIIRKYFINMERALKLLQDHEAIREPEKENYNKMKEEIIKKYSNQHSVVTESDKKFLMIRESNMINKNLTGLYANEIKTKLGYNDIQTREHLELCINKAIDEIEILITNLVIAGVGFEERSKIVENICKNKYSNLRMDEKELVNV